MVHSVELLLDPALDAAVREQWAALEGAGVRNAGRHTGPSNRPHVTLAVAARVPADREEVIAAAAAGVPRATAATAAGVGAEPGLDLPLLLGGLVLFGHRDEFVLARLVVPSAELLELQRRVVAAVGDDGLGHVRPGEWTPHVTLGRRLRPPDVAAALAVPGLAAERRGTGVAVRRWDSEARRDWVIA
ncbi:2'-5' RNA ligase family protein [Nakamurella endophytica]|uniref:2'-5' RNA ligase family protein n=1 Tax=Nakamurella endophytica TaxID=1748367 RepID=A0A917SX30_9ACTN|nr:2'-5' RNA ligase family protein [Nakamurella endophytica]GGM03108.1 hypothetical protein GCM10011594_24060 [Nakamurella endophytica]